MTSLFEFKCDCGHAFEKVEEDEQGVAVEPCLACGKPVTGKRINTDKGVE